MARVELALGEQAKGLRASTFHTFCMYLLRRIPKAFGLEQFSIIDRDDQLMMFRLIRGRDDKKIRITCRSHRNSVTYIPLRGIPGKN